MASFIPGSYDASGLPPCGSCGVASGEHCRSRGHRQLFTDAPHRGRSSGRIHKPRVVAPAAPRPPRPPIIGKPKPPPKPPRPKPSSPPPVHARKLRAKHRGIAWELSDDHALTLLAQPCHYCGGHGGTIDRSDSSGPYAAGNVVPSCLRCNLMKNAMALDEWVGHMRKIIAYLDG